ncbi:arylamine N-acetyltransferase family protein [Gordonia phthalatica]|uniref:Acetyltransferase n=1 Tax=Gordonia phthalatica TaxID=1136941 RepID=A0A0N9MLV0_9ACTN|nr:arylamine N-acetyltransferase [Gordonia phthalatica]ALG83534.1 acetyltransferase [Gordonia phthalatica]
MSVWHSDQLDLSAYLDRIGVPGPLSPTPDTLRTLHRAHVASIPFENLEIIVGRPVPLDLSSLQAKLVDRRRGGYCFEHATLLAAALEQLGFRFTALSGRVVLGGDPATRPPTHALIVVEFDDGSRHLCDVGFGRGPLEPIPLVDGTEADQGGWRFRLTRQSMDDLFATDRWTLHQHGREWVARHVFTLNPQFPIDWAVGNHFVSTSPRSPFTARTFVQRFSAAEHHTLDATTWTVELPNGEEAVQEVDPARLPALLADVFGIDLDDADAQSLVSAETARAAKNPQ